MFGKIYHVGLTVTDMNQSIDFYQNVLGFKLTGELLMEGPETDALFQRKGCRIRVVYLVSNDEIETPPIELIKFLDDPEIIHRSELQIPSISEVCFKVKDIYALYRHLLDNDVECLSEPQMFDFTNYGFSKSMALYFRDPNGIILEAMQELNH